MYWIGWFADYPDPYDFINILLDGRTIGAEEQHQHLVLRRAHVSAARWTRRRSLTGDARYRAYGTLDIDITRNQSPLVDLRTTQNVREFISSKVGLRRRSPSHGAG